LLGLLLTPNGPESGSSPGAYDPLVAWRSSRPRLCLSHQVSQRRRRGPGLVELYEPTRDCDGRGAQPDVGSS
jgi:hypothetical protein